MATQTRTVLPVANYTNQTRISPSIDVPASLKSFTVRMVSAEFTDPSLLCVVVVRESYDGGTTWNHVAGFTADGGHDKFGKPRQPSVKIVLSDQQRSAALMQASVEAAGTWRYGFVLDLET